MTKMPFTPDGVKAKAAELFKLSDLERTAQAEAVWRDIRAWLNDNFTFEPPQQQYLADMDDRYLSYIASNLGIAIELKIDITMQTMTPRDPWIAKWITVVVNFQLINSARQAVTGDGQLKFMVNYA